jgi:uncharacterized Tic20 family protein
LVLELRTEEILEFGKEPDTKYLVYFHLSVLAFLVIPTGNIILPLILWLTKKDKISGLDKIGPNLLNFQIVWTVCSFLSIMGFAFLKIIHFGGEEILMYVFLGLYAFNIVLPILFAIKTKKGKPKKMYPGLVRLVK